MDSIQLSIFSVLCSIPFCTCNTDELFKETQKALIPHDKQSLNKQLRVLKNEFGLIKMNRIKPFHTVFLLGLTDYGYNFAVSNQIAVNTGEVA